MAIKHTTYSGTFLKTVQPFAVKVTKGLIRDVVFAGNMQQKEYTLFICRLTELLTSNWRSLNVYHQEQRRNKKRKHVEILYAENSILYQII